MCVCACVCICVWVRVRACGVGRRARDRERVCARIENVFASVQESELKHVCQKDRECV